MLRAKDCKESIGLRETVEAMMKKLVAFLMTLCVGVFIVGCGESGPATGGVEGSGDTAVPTSTPQDEKMMEEMMGGAGMSEEMKARALGTSGRDAEKAP